MASEPTDGGTVSVGLPADLEAWLDERADELGLDRDDLLQRLLAAYRTAATADEEFEPQGVDERLTRLERRHQEALEDVRKRVLQLKDRTEGKVDADHEALERVDEFDERVTALETRVEELTEHSVGREELTDVQEKLTRVASAVVALREDGARAPAVDEADDSAAEPAAPGVDAEAADRLLDIKRTAAREGYERAACGACDESAHVHLLPEPACPACGTPFDALVETGGFRTRPTLVGAGGAGE